MKTTHRNAVRRLAWLLLLGAPLGLSNVLADPPPWAPAHGYRGDEHGRGEHEREDDDDREHGYRGYDGRVWTHDYGVSHGSCDRAAVGAAIGGMVGGAVGSTVGNDSNRTVAILTGAAFGSLIGYQIGREMDRADRSCMGHALELAPYGHDVRWRNDRRGVSYVVTPIGPWAAGGPDCRKFRVQVVGHDRDEARVMRACRSGDGEWNLVKL